MAFELPDLPYAPDALEPTLSAETLKLHHGKHHAGYVKKLNKALEDAGIEGKTLEEVIHWAAESADRTGVFNNAAQAWNHTFFWWCMTPDGGGKPDGELLRAIEKSFGTFDKFRDAFIEAGAGQFGSGWVWLAIDSGKLTVEATPNADMPLVGGKQPILTCDVWEHAYYLDYQNRREGFLKAFMDELVNWEFVAERFAMQGEGNVVAARQYRDAQETFARSGKVEAAARAAKDSLAS